jgi:alginate O-acetyltransferase complex protein AlgI
VIYSSVEFFVFFPIVFVLYWAVRNDAVRLGIILMGSLLFYAYSRADFVVLLLGIIVFGWAAGLVIGRRAQDARVLLGLAVGVLLATLAVFKYGHLVIEPLAARVPVPGRLELWIAIMPLGISFFVFEVVSYLSDVRAGRVRPETSLFRFALFISFFPHLIAGPIMRAWDLLPQLGGTKRFVPERVVSGLQLFVGGFVKKVVIADSCGRVADVIFAGPSHFGTGALWIGAIAYTAQIFGDFSGYTDMGRGIARTLGYELPVNFVQPYLATSPRDFWRRWHISLSSWLRDYLYKPLGGNRRGEARSYVNLVVTMFLGGLWHGSNWTFAVWGLYHGALLAAQRVLGRWQAVPALPRPLASASTLLLVIFGWVVFRAASISDAAEMLGGMLLPRTGDGLRMENVLIALGGLAATLAWSGVIEFAPQLARRVVAGGRLQAAGWGVAAALLAYLVPIAEQPFIYFRF